MDIPLTFIISLLIVALIFFVYVWWKTKDKRVFPETRILDLTMNNCLQVDTWIRNNITMTTYDPDFKATMATFLKNIFQLDVDKNLLLYSDTSLPYPEINSTWNSNRGILSLREVIGISGYIIYGSTKSSQCDLLSSIVNSKADLLLNKYIGELLDKRWRVISQSELLINNKSGSYLYINDLPPNIIGHQEADQYRLNLLSSDLEFTTMIKRLTTKTVEAVI